MMNPKFSRKSNMAAVFSEEFGIYQKKLNSELLKTKKSYVVKIWHNNLI